MKNRLIHTLALTTVVGIASVHEATARDNENFVKIAQRAIADNKATGDSTVTNPDADWHGAGFTAVTSRGNILPNAMVEYKRGKWQVHADLTMDIGKNSTDKNSLKSMTSGATDNTASNVLSNYADEKLNLDFKFTPRQADELTFSIFENYRHARSISSIMKEYYDAAGAPTQDKYEDKTIWTNNLNLGVLAEYKHLFEVGGSIAARAYFKYDTNPTDVDYRVWTMATDKASAQESQHYHSADPKFQIVYLSPDWHGFSFGVREKLALLRTKVDNETSYVNFNTTNSLTSAALNYKHGSTALMGYASYEYYDQDLELVGEFSQPKTFNDWQCGGSLVQGIGEHHELKLTYDQLITRPTYMQLYPLVHVGTSGLGDPVKGNPDLKPSMQKKTALAYTQKYTSWKLTTKVEYSNITDEISGVSFKTATGASYNSWANDATKNTVKLQLNGEVKRGCFNMTCGAHAMYQDYEGEKVRADRSWSFSFKACPEVTLPAQWSVYLVAIYTGKEKHQYYDTDDYIYTALGAQKRIGRWILYGMVQDISESDERKTYYYDTSTNVQSVSYHSRAAIMGVSYQF